MTFDAGSTPDPIAVGAPLNAIDFRGRLFGSVLTDRGQHPVQRHAQRVKLIIGQRVKEQFTNQCNVVGVPTGYQHYPPGPCGGLPPHLPSLAGRRLMVVACSVPPLSMVPRALRHLPGVIASLLAEACLVYLVLSSTVTIVCLVLPLVSLLVTVMVLPATEATASRSARPRAPNCRT